MGNEALTTPDQKDISGHILRAGGFTSSLNESDSTNRSKLPKRQSSKTWADDSHTFEVKWSSGLIVVKVDGVEYGQQTVGTAFGKQVNQKKNFIFFFIDVRWICFIILLNFVLTLKGMELFYCSHI